MYAQGLVVIQNFRGIDGLELEFKHGYPSVLIGSNKAGKTCVLNAIAMALNGGDYYKYDVVEDDFYCNDAGKYVGTQAKIDLKPDTQLIEEWLAQNASD